MNRPRKVVCVIALGLALSCSVASCGISDGGSTSGKFLEIVNNTSVTVTMQSCPGIASDPQQCATAVRIPPNGSADFPLLSPGSGGRIVVITGYDGKACLPVPTTHLRADAIADVTEANSGLCFGPVGGSPVALGHSFRTASGSTSYAKGDLCPALAGCNGRVPRGRR